MQHVTGVACDPGFSRQRNEDAFACSGACDIVHDRGYVYPHASGLGELYAVADGVGGSAEGQHASLLALSTLASYYYERGNGAPAQRLEEAVRAANAAVVAFDEEMDASGSTTLTALLIDGSHGVIAHVGDSRLYRIHAGAITQLTQDHDLVGEYVRSGIMTVEEAARSELSSVITRCIGKDPEVVPDIAEIAVTSEDCFVLCSDGLTSHVSDMEIYQTVTDTRDPQAAADALIQFALSRGGEDNITAMVIRSARETHPHFIFTFIQFVALFLLLASLMWLAYSLTLP